MVEADDEERQPGRARRAPELVAPLAGDELRAAQAHANGVVRDQKRCAYGLALADQTAVGGGVDAPVAEGVDLGRLAEVENVVDRTVPEKLLERAGVQRGRRVNQEHVPEPRMVDQPASAGRKSPRTVFAVLRSNETEPADAAAASASENASA